MSFSAWKWNLLGQRSLSSLELSLYINNEQHRRASARGAWVLRAGEDLSHISMPTVMCVYLKSDSNVTIISHTSMPTSPVSCLMPPVSYLLSPISHLPSPISHLPSPISYLLSPISHLPSPISYLLLLSTLSGEEQDDVVDCAIRHSPHLPRLLLHLRRRGMLYVVCGIVYLAGCIKCVVCCIVYVVCCM
jgi:hypothetical protein